MSELTQDSIRSLFNYQDGNLYWKAAIRNKINIGDQAGYVNNRDYRLVKIGGENYLAHRLIFLYHHGYLPEFLDHIDRNPLNNSIDNLREATRQENNRNKKKEKTRNGKPTSSIYKGVSWHKPTKKWQVQIYVDSKPKYLGYFTSEIDAAKAYDKAAVKHFGEFAKINGDNSKPL